MSAAEPQSSASGAVPKSDAVELLSAVRDALLANREATERLFATWEREMNQAYAAGLEEGLRIADERQSSGVADA